MVLIRPATSGRNVTDSSERRLPTAVMVCGSDAVATLTASTVTLAAPGAPPLGAPCDDRLLGAPEGTEGPPRCVPNQ